MDLDYEELLGTFGLFQHLEIFFLVAYHIEERVY